jgi:PAS domain S-box-containing protein
MSSSDPAPLKSTQFRPEVSEETFRLLVESVKDYGIFLLDSTGRIKSWNQGAARIKGYAADEIIGKNFAIFYTQADRERGHPQEELETAKKEGRYEEEGWRVRKDGTQFWANIVITRLTDAEGRILGFAKVTRDLTERKAAEDLLRESEERARLFYENVRDYAIITLDKGGIITGWNEGAHRINGYEAGEIIGRHFSTFYPTDDVTNGKCEYELTEAATTGRFEDEGWRVRKDGTKFWANVVITALYDHENQLRGYSKVTRDITERKRAEDRLRMANEGLERRVQERTTALTAVNETLRNEVNERKRAEQELHQAVRSRDEFLSIASHELRTPVTPLKLQLQGLLKHLRQDTLKSLPSERLEKMANTIDRSLGRLVNLIDSLLDVARINAGKIELHPEEIDISEVIQETCQRFQQEGKLYGSDITIEAPPRLAGFFDRTRLEQIVSNLTVNAIKYGNGKPIQVSVFERDGKLVIAVKDHGIGIERADLHRIFNRFEQIGKHAGAGGLGLGLYITKQIVDAHGGKIEVKSKPGEGSVFVVELPMNRTGANQHG